MENPWYEAVLDQCAITHMPFYDDDPKKTIDGIIDWHVMVALDPSVSTDAHALLHECPPDCTCVSDASDESWFIHLLGGLICVGFIATLLGAGALLIWAVNHV